MDHKLIRKLTQRDPSAPVSDNLRLTTVEEHFSRFSLIDKYPHGDEAMPVDEKPGPMLSTVGPVEVDDTASESV